MSSKGLDGFFPIRGFGHQFQVRLSIHQCRKPFPQNGMVVYCENSDNVMSAVHDSSLAKAELANAKLAQCQPGYWPFILSLEGPTQRKLNQARSPDRVDDCSEWILADASAGHPG